MQMMALLLLYVLLFAPLIALVVIVGYYVYVLRLPSAPDMTHFRGKLLGHRGCRNNYDIPENSMMAFRYAHEHGADGIEIDVYLSSDDEIVVHHDPTVDATTFGTGRVCDYTFAELNALRFRPKRQRRRTASESAGDEEQDGPQPHASNQSNAPLPTRTGSQGAAWTPTIPLPPNLRKGEDVDGPPSLKQVILFCEAHGLYLMIEFKESQRPTLLFRKLIALYDEHPWLYQRSFVASFLLPQLVELRRLAPHIPVCYLFCRKILEWTYNEKLAGRLPLPLPWWVEYAPTRFAVDWLLENLAYTPLLSILGFRMIGPEVALATDTLFRRMDAAGVVGDGWVVNTRRDRARIERLGGVVTTDKVFNVSREDSRVINE